MKGKMEKNTILTLRKQGKAIREIARVTGFSKNTVKKYIRDYEVKMDLINSGKLPEETIIRLQEEVVNEPTRKRARTCNRIFKGKLEDDFNNILRLHEEKDNILGRNKQKLTAKKIHKELLKKGHKIGASTVQIKFRKYKDTYKETFIKQQYNLGQRAEYDFHQVKLCIGNKVVIYHQATIAAPTSNTYFIKLYKDETINSVIDSIVSFFNHCGGVYKEMVFDNMSTVVKRLIIGKKEKEYTEDIIKLSNYYGFKIVTCNVAKGNEKGTVENGGKFIRNDFFSLNFKFDTEEDLVNYYTKELEVINSTSYEVFAKEKEALIELPIRPYVKCNNLVLKVNSYSTIRVNNNYYSVPDTLIGETLTVRDYIDTIVIDGIYASKLFWSKNRTDNICVNHT